MIYCYPSQNTEIKQGDIFVGLPWFDFSMDKIKILNSKEVNDVNWSDVVGTNEAVDALLTVRPVTAIVANQDCDNIRAKYITLCAILPFDEVFSKKTGTITQRDFIKVTTKHDRINLKWFYLPNDNKIGFTQKMAVDFFATIRVQRVELEQLRNFRKGTLNDTAGEHFREKLSEFYRRYPYNEWYPLDKDEFLIYKKDHPEAKPYSWQR